MAALSPPAGPLLIRPSQSFHLSSRLVNPCLCYSLQFRLRFTCARFHRPSLSHRCTASRSPSSPFLESSSTTFVTSSQSLSFLDRSQNRAAAPSFSQQYRDLKFSLVTPRIRNIGITRPRTVNSIAAAIDCGIRSVLSLHCTIAFRVDVQIRHLHLVVHSMSTGRVSSQYRLQTRA